MDHGKKPKRSSGKESAESEEDLAGNRRRREGQGWEIGNLGGKAREREEREGSLTREKERKEEEKAEKHRAEEASAIRKKRSNCREESEILFSVERKKEEEMERPRKRKGGEFDTTCGGWPRGLTGRFFLLLICTCKGAKGSKTSTLGLE